MAMEKDVADTKKATAELSKQMKELSKKMDMILSMLKEKSEAGSMGGDALVTIREASKILGVNPNKVKALTDSGEIIKVEPPGCRGKILRSSIDSYIRNMAG